MLFLSMALAAAALVGEQEVDVAVGGHVERMPVGAGVRRTVVG